MKVKLLHGVNGKALYLDNTRLAGVEPYGNTTTDFEAEIEKEKVSEVMTLLKKELSLETTLDLPCKVGETLWVLHRLTKIPIKVTVDGYQYNGETIFVRYHDNDTYDTAVLGRGIFASREDAINKLNKSESDNPFIEPAKQLVEMESKGLLPDKFDMETALQDRKFVGFLFRYSSAEEAVKKYAEAVK